MSKLRERPAQLRQVFPRDSGFKGESCIPPPFPLFHSLIQQVKTRSVGEVVQFYYLWKKTERHDVFANKARLEKKKYNLNPCVTDFMDKYLEEYDNGGTNRDRSASPNVNNSNSLLLADSKHRIRSDSSVNNNEKPALESVEIKTE
jgi:hypothetical protein